MKLRAELLAPCGANCGICMGYLRTKNSCPGCMFEGKNKPLSCQKCIIVNCLKLPKSHLCVDCLDYPCARIKALDKRYITRYNYSMIENLTEIKNIGIDAHMINVNKKWICECGGVICVHRGFCVECGKVRYLGPNNMREAIK